MGIQRVFYFAPMVLLATDPAFCQYVPTDVSPQVTLVGSATPQQQWVGDTMQMYEPSGMVVTTAICSYATLTYFCGPTNAKSISVAPDGTHRPGVWGHDEGPSVQLSVPATDNRISFFWGDSLTAYNPAMVPPRCLSSVCM